MIGKVGSSTSVGGTSRYLQGDTERVEWQETHNLASNDPDFVRQQMEQTATMSKTEDPAYHFSISWDEADNPSRQQMQEVAHQTLDDIGLGEHQAVIVAHNDRPYQHLHVMVNRVHPETGNVWDRWMDYIKIEKSLRGQERARGWTEVPGHHHQLEDQVKPEFGNSYNSFEAAQMKKGQQPLFMYARDNASQIFQEASSWEQLHEELEEVGLTVQRGSRGTGGKITNGKNYTNLSKIDRDFSMGNLEKRLGPFRPKQPSKQVQKGREVAKELSKALKNGATGKVNKCKNALKKAIGAAANAKKAQSLMTNILAGPNISGVATKIVKSFAKQVSKQHDNQQSM